MAFKRCKVFGVGGERRFSSRRAHGATRETAEDHRTLRHQVGMLAQPVGHVVEEFVETDEAATFDVPVRFLDRERQVDRVCQAIVQEANHLVAGVVGKVGNKGGGHGRTGNKDRDTR